MQKSHVAYNQRKYAPAVCTRRSPACMRGIVSHRSRLVCATGLYAISAFIRNFMVVLVPELHHRTACKADRIDHHCRGACSTHTAPSGYFLAGDDSFSFFFSPHNTYSEITFGAHARTHAHKHNHRASISENAP